MILISIEFVSELSALKKKVLKDISENEIEIFQIPECDSDEEEFKRKDRELKVSLDRRFRRIEDFRYNLIILRPQCRLLSSDQTQS